MSGLEHVVESEIASLREMIELEQGKKSVDYLARCLAGLSAERQVEVLRFAHSAKLNTGDPAIVAAMVLGHIQRVAEAAGDGLVEKVEEASDRFSHAANRTLETTASVFQSHIHAATLAVDAVFPAVDRAAEAASLAADAADRCAQAFDASSESYRAIADEYIEGFRKETTGAFSSIIQTATTTIFGRVLKDLESATGKHLEETKKGQHDAVVDLAAVVKNLGPELMVHSKKAVLEAAREFEATRSKADPFRIHKLAAMVLAVVLSISATAGVGFANGRSSGYAEGKAEGLLIGEDTGRNKARNEMADHRADFENERVRPFGVRFDMLKREYTNAAGQVVCSLNADKANPYVFESHQKSCAQIGVDLNRKPL